AAAGPPRAAVPGDPRRGERAPHPPVLVDPGPDAGRRLGGARAGGAGERAGGVRAPPPPHPRRLPPRPRPAAPEPAGRTLARALPAGGPGPPPPPGDGRGLAAPGTQ